MCKTLIISLHSLKSLCSNSHRPPIQIQWTSFIIYWWRPFLQVLSKNSTRLFRWSLITVPLQTKNNFGNQLQLPIPLDNWLTAEKSTSPPTPLRLSFAEIPLVWTTSISRTLSKQPINLLKHIYGRTSH